MRNKLILVGALILGLLAAFLVYNYISSAKQAIQNQSYTQVVTAAVDIPANATITDTMVVLKPFPTELLTQQEILDVKDAVGKLPAISFTKGEIITQNRLVKPGESTARLSYKIPVGMRAMTVPVSEVTDVAFLPKIGDRVDIIGIIPVTAASPEPRAAVILQNIEIIARGTSMSETPAAGGEQPSVATATVTLAVDPQTALRLKMAMQSTNFSFTLRSAADKNIVTLVPVTLKEL